MLQSVEFTATARGDNFVFFTSNGYTKYQSLIDMIHTAAPDVTVLSKTSLDGKNVIVARTSKAPEQIIKEMRANGFVPAGSYDRLPWQHMMWFGREGDSADPAAPAPPEGADLGTAAREETAN